jgi:WhiB family redox-sensing transcriptional regulator
MAVSDDKIMINDPIQVGEIQVGTTQIGTTQIGTTQIDETQISETQISDAAGLSLVAAPSEGLPPELAWQERALCAQTDPEAFFPEKGGSTREAKRVCMSCDVRSECLEYALAKDERFGIWGGLSERERRRVKKQAV